MDELDRLQRIETEWERDVRVLESDVRVLESALKQAREELAKASNAVVLFISQTF